MSESILLMCSSTSLATNGVFALQVGGSAKYCEKLDARTMIWNHDRVECADYVEILKII